MISGIYNAGKYVQVTNGVPSRPNIYNYNYSGQPNGPQSFAGQIRYSISNQCIEIFDGSMWQQWNNSVANVGLSPEAERIMDWARQKMDEEALLITRMEKHPVLKDAYERFKVLDVLTLTQEHADH